MITIIGSKILNPTKAANRMDYFLTNNDYYVAKLEENIFLAMS